MIAETTTALQTLSVSEAVMELDMTGAPVVIFCHAASGRLNIVYRRPDGNIGWIDPERMKKDYELVQTYLGMEKPFAVESAFTTRLLDTSIKMDASKARK